MTTHSQLIPVWKLLYQRLASLAPGAGINEAEVLFGNRTDPPMQGVVVSGLPSNVSSFQFATFEGVDEKFVLRVKCYAFDEAQDHLAALDRLDPYVQFVLDAVRDATTGRVITWYQTTLALKRCEPAVVGFTATTTGDPRGVRALGEVDIRWTVRI